MGKEDRGFASMDRAKQREIASRGGKMAHVKGRAHEWTPEEARQAGRKSRLAGRDRSKPAAGERSEVVDGMPDSRVSPLLQQRPKRPNVFYGLDSQYCVD
jgi:general stress protein YciG